MIHETLCICICSIDWRESMWCWFELKTDLFRFRHPPFPDIWDPLDGVAGDEHGHNEQVNVGQSDFRPPAGVLWLERSQLRNHRNVNDSHNLRGSVKSYSDKSWMRQNFIENSLEINEPNCQTCFIQFTSSQFHFKSAHNSNIIQIGYKENMQTFWKCRSLCLPSLELFYLF